MIPFIVRTALDGECRGTLGWADFQEDDVVPLICSYHMIPSIYSGANWFVHNAAWYNHSNHHKGLNK